MGAKALTTGCVLTCSFGTVPMPFVSLPLPGKPVVNGMPVGLITDTLPINIPPFVLCMTQANPAVAAATAAALGTPTPAPCLPVITPWTPPSLVATYNGVPLATVSSKATCTFGGVISVSVPNNLIVDV